ncbi:hypothetical protein CTI12_AA142480 [Artemisia annua]|uniref:Homologous recombination OB-fold protein OB-fold domain-containing protein n=1 Tax=Artemisia annua TaxID=35608 RepID=A0A2U1PKH6_ARTAN|nr:hypothetical protein CTI12_AA142480 [Artemisia annua]
MAEKGPSYVATYTLCGFAVALKVWILETYPNAINWWVKEESVIPRALAWEDGPKFENNDYDLFFCSNYHVRLLPTDVERNQLWWSSSLDYFGRFMPSGSFNDVPPSLDMNTPKVTVEKVDEGDDSDFRSGPWVNATEFINGNGGMMVGVFADIKKFLNKGKFEKVVGIIKSCTLNVLGDLTVTIKDVSGLISGPIHHKVLADEILAKALTVGAVLVLKNISVFSLKQSGRHYLNITIRNVVKVFYNDEVVSVTEKA